MAAQSPLMKAKKSFLSLHATTQENYAVRAFFKMALKIVKLDLH